MKDSLVVAALVSFALGCLVTGFVFPEFIVPTVRFLCGAALFGAFFLMFLGSAAEAYVRRRDKLR